MLYKRGNVYWAYHWIDGVRRAQSTGTSNRKQAEMIAQRFKDELNLERMGMIQPKPEMTFGELAARFLADGSPRPYHYDRLKVLLPFWAETQIGRITKSLAKEYRKQRHAEKKILSDITVNRDLEALRHILYWAVDEGILLTNPLRGMFMAQQRRKARVMISVAEEDKLLAAAAPHLRSIIVAALDTGMRRGELLSQRWEHVDFSRRLLYVTHSKTAGGESREIPFTERLLHDLESRRQSDGLVFTFKGAAIHRIKTAWKGAIRRSGIRYVRFHDLRHACNTRLLEAGVMQEVRKALMGHSNRQEVNSIYTHVELPMLRQAIARLEEWTAQQRTNLKKGESNDGTSGVRPDQERNPAESSSRSAGSQSPVQ